MKSSHLTAIGGAVSAIIPLSAAAQDKDLRPNFVIMIADDCSYYDWGCYGNKDAITPNIDELAEHSMKFNRCFQQAPMSSPTRHALYTGIYPVKSGAYPNHTYVYDNVKSFVQYFAPEGYRTALLGKQHVAPASVFAYEYLGSYSDGRKSEEHLNYDRLEKFIDSTGNSPFFLVVASNEPHSPWTVGDTSQWDPNEITVPQGYVDTPETRRDLVNYYAEINFFDKQVGRILCILEDKRVADNTVFVLLSEQGNSFPFAKWTCYKNGLQSAMLIRWPGVATEGSQSDALVEYVDIVPTLMDIAGLSIVPLQTDGKSFKKVLSGEQTTHKRYSFGIQTSRGIIQGPQYYGIRSVKDGRYDYIINLTPEVAFKNTVTAQTEDNGGFWRSWIREAEAGNEFARRRVEKYQYRPTEELYDMLNDPWEMNNLADDPAFQEKKAELRAALATWMQQQGDQGQATEMDALPHLLKNMGKDKKR